MLRFRFWSNFQAEVMRSGRVFSARRQKVLLARLASPAGFDRRHPVEQCFEQDLHLQPRQMQAEALVRPCTESKVPV